MTNERVASVTGRSMEAWYDAIAEAGLAEAPHPEIAAFLEKEHGVDPWWAQELTVEYEKSIGRRVVGQTADGLFQIGVSRTINSALPELWQRIVGSAGLQLLLGEAPQGSVEELSGSTSEGIRYELTTYVPDSHLRMRFALPVWERSSILQIRLTAKEPNRTIVTFHQERLPTQDAREEMRARWKKVLSSLAAED